VQVLDHGIAIKQAVEQESPTSAVVVGGGYVGLEMAEAFVARGMKVTLVDRGAQPMSTLDPDMGALVADAMRSMGIVVYTSEAVIGYETKSGRVSAVVTDERTIPTELVVLGLGVRPNTELAGTAGIPTGPTTGVVTNERMHTTVESVWSAGDCAEKFHRISGKPVAIALGTHANKEGRVAGINIGGGKATFPGVIGTAASKMRPPAWMR
jgi:NADPH-dependent 2,4-dienoyl-CoA reductase/sulfur reductase-like enzyme